MDKIKTVIAYDGSCFKGWQIQPGEKTVQDSLESAIEKIAGKKIKVHGAGRTDSGVHALGQVAHFDAPLGSKMSADDWHRALNVNLPPTIRVLSSEPVKKDFHARFSAKSKTYKYVMDTSLILGPHKFLRTWHHPKKINISKLKEACSLYEGTHDFASFAVNRGDGKDIKTERTIFSVEVNSDQEDTLIMSFSGNGFLYKMVRLLVGAAVRVAEGKKDVDWIREMLQNPGKSKCQYCAKPDGLYLEKVVY